MMNGRLSNKFRWLGFIATWTVVCIHSNTIKWDSQSTDYGNSLQLLIADIFHFAVPLFFVISGYMFVGSYERRGWKQLLCSKFKSLYIPLVSWSILGVIACLPIRIYAKHDVPTFSQVSLLPLMVLRSEAVHFWYVRALVFIAILSPLVMACVKRKWMVFIIIVASLLIPESSVLARYHIPVIAIYFSAGGVLAISGYKGSLFSPLSTWFLFLSCLIGLLFANLVRMYISDHYYCTLVQPALMIGCLWFGYDLLEFRGNVKKYPEWLKVMFPVYCMHIIVLCWVGGIIREVLGTSAIARVFGYFLLWFTFWVDVCVANLIRRRLPNFYLILSGGR